jgi:putative oxidoreductase
VKIVALICRILLGLMFVVFGLNGFFHFIPQPTTPPPPDMLAFVTVLMKSHYMVPVFALQVIGGALLLIGRFVPLGLALLGPVIVNILITHILLQPSGLPPGAIAAVLWLVLFYAYRQYFATLFTASAQPS